MVERAIAVLGAGAWGTVLARLCAGKGIPTTLWARRPELAAAINATHENRDRLPGVLLPDELRATSDPSEAVRGATTLVVAFPSHALRDRMEDFAPVLDDHALLVSVTKGIEQGSLMRMTEVIAQTTGAAHARVAALGGPNLATEVARGQPTATVVACPDRTNARRLQHLFHTQSFFCFANDDVLGVEVGGACKNVIALAAGMADGLGYGHNSVSALVTRGLAEIARLGLAMGAELQTFLGLAGVGDLVATCMSPLSRNHRVGREIGLGRAPADVLAGTRQVAEGVSASRPILALARRAGVKMPIAWRVKRILFDGARPEDMLVDMMMREPEHEFRAVELAAAP